MAKIQGGVPVAGFMSPTDSADVYAVTKEEYHQGGYRSVATEDEMNAITEMRRKTGMLVYVTGSDKTYRLNAEGNFVEVTSSGDAPQVDLTKVLRKYAVGTTYAAGDAVYYTDATNGYSVFVAKEAFTAADANPVDGAEAEKWEKSWSSALKADIQTGVDAALISWKWKGFVADLTALNAVVEPKTGDVYLVGEELTASDFYVRLNNETTPDNSRWVKFYEAPTIPPSITLFETGKEYAVGDVVYETVGDVVYIWNCITAHTSDITSILVEDGNTNWKLAYNSDIVELVNRANDINGTNKGIVAVSAALYPTMTDLTAGVNHLETGHIYFVGNSLDNAKAYMFIKDETLDAGGVWKAVCDAGASGGGSATYTNTMAVPNAIGGIAKGTTFNNMTMEEVFNMLFYPYQAPGFTSLSVGKTAFGIGESTGNTINVSWDTSNKNNINANSIILKYENAVIGNDLGNSGNNQPFTITPTVKNAPGSTTVYIELTNTKGEKSSRTATLSWTDEIFYGVSNNPTITDVTGLTKMSSNTVAGRTYSYPGGGYKYLVFPSRIGTPTEWKDEATNLQVPFEVLPNITYTNAHGAVIECKVLKTLNVLGGAIKIVVK